jgi:hypothetical protein
MGAINSLFVLGRSIGFIGKLSTCACHIFGTFAVNSCKNPRINFTVSIPCLSTVTTKEMMIQVFWDMMVHHWVSCP